MTPRFSPPAPRWTDLRTRIGSAALLLPTAALCIWVGGAAWIALVVAAGGLLAWEWVRLCGASTARLPGAAVPAMLLGAGLLAICGAPLSALGVLVGGAAALRQRGAWLGFGVLYLGLPVLALLALRADPAAGRANVLFLFAVVWASDIGAYAAGRWLRGPRLAPLLSPSKTWSGALGGLLAALAAGALAAYVAAPGAEPVVLAPVLATAGLLGLLAQVGDLFESWIKRRFDVKDTSALIPGHGGLLDRLDGVLAAAPAACLLALSHGPGRPLWG